MFKISASKAGQIHDGSNPVWHLEAVAEGGQEKRTRFILRGKTMSPIEPNEQSDLEFVYVVGRVGLLPVCLEASVTNLTGHSSFSSKKEGFDAQGFARVWKRTTIKPGSPPRHVEVTFKEVELNHAFIDGEVFGTDFPANYTVSDVTSGQSAVLQRPWPAVMTIQPKRK